MGCWADEFGKPGDGAFEVWQSVFNFCHHQRAVLGHVKAPGNRVPQPGDSKQSLTSFSQAASAFLICFKHLKLKEPLCVQRLQWQPCSQFQNSALVLILGEIPGTASRGGWRAEIVGPSVNNELRWQNGSRNCTIRTQK